MNRSAPNQPQMPRMAPQAAAPDYGKPAMQNKHANGWRGMKGDWLTASSYIGPVVLLVVAALLIAAVAWYIHMAPPSGQSRFLNKTKMQAVFLNTGQVYFGNVVALTKDYITLTNIWYLQSPASSGNSQQSQQNQNLTLTKLGCELHMPYDEMVINMNQVTFWENIQDGGQVATKIKQYWQQNPNGQACSNQTPGGQSSNPQSQATPSTNSTTR